jgi:O-antigen ligase
MLQNRLNYLFIAYAFSIPLSRAGIVVFSLLITLLWLFKKSKKEDLLLAWNNHAIKALGIYFIYNVVSLLWVESKNFGHAFEAVVKYWYFFPIVIIVSNIEKSNILKVISAFIFGVFISELLSYGIFFELITMKHGTPSDPTPFMTHLDYALFLSFTSLMVLSRLLYEESLKHRLFYVFFFTTVTINLFITGGRVGYLIFMITLVILFLYRFENKLRALLSSVLILGFILSFAYYASPTFKSRVQNTQESLEKLYYHQDYCSSWGTRVGAFIVAKEVVEMAPIFGVGIEDHIDALQTVIKAKYPDMKCFSWYMHYHNQYLEIVAKTGMVGLVLFLTIFYMLWQMKFEVKEFEVIKVILLSVYLIGFFADPFFILKQFTMAMFILFFALLNAQYLFEQGKRI